jgi:hypothetical protein
MHDVESSHFNGIIKWVQIDDKDRYISREERFRIATARQWQRGRWAW